MPTRPLPPVIGATENALRSLLTRALTGSRIDGYEEWVYLNIRDTTDRPAEAERLITDALEQPHDRVAATRTRLVEAGLLNSDGSLTAAGHEQLDDCRQAVARTTQALVAGIAPAVLQATIDTLDTIRSRAEQLLLTDLPPTGILDLQPSGGHE